MPFPRGRWRSASGLGVMVHPVASGKSDSPVNHRPPKAVSRARCGFFKPTGRASLFHPSTASLCLPPTESRHVKGLVPVPHYLCTVSAVNPRRHRLQLSMADPVTRHGYVRYVFCGHNWPRRMGRSSKVDLPGTRTKDRIPSFEYPRQRILLEHFGSGKPGPISFLPAHRHRVNVFPIIQRREPSFPVDTIDERFIEPG
jgi:hypothetical protein